MNSIDEDWESFLQDDFDINNINDSVVNNVDTSSNNFSFNPNPNISDVPNYTRTTQGAERQFHKNSLILTHEGNELITNGQLLLETEAPKCSKIYISTKTKIAFLKCEIDIKNVFWKLPVLEYSDAKEGIIKKQMKITTHSIEETEEIQKKIDATSNTVSNLLSHVDSTKQQQQKTVVKYKHIQKISIGISKKDITSYRLKKKSAFFNCFALILRMFYEGEYKEVHVKVFNTGKLEIPGIRSNKLLHKTIDKLCCILEDITKEPVEYNEEDIDTVLINSNFNCGYYINREKLFNLLKIKYKLITMYDPCSYPGIQTKFYFNKCKVIQDGICNCLHACNKKNNNDKINKENKCKEISFMIFRTGSILIVGNCNEEILYEIYDYIVKILEGEFRNINEGLLSKELKKKTTKKIKKITILVD